MNEASSGIVTSVAWTTGSFHHVIDRRGLRLDHVRQQLQAYTSLQGVSQLLSFYFHSPGQLAHASDIHIDALIGTLYTAPQMAGLALSQQLRVLKALLDRCLHCFPTGLCLRRQSVVPVTCIIA